MFRLRTGILLALAGLGVILLAACNPSLNWREVRQKDSPLLALMPCKPDASSRNISLGGREVVMHLNSCDAAGASFVVGSADIASSDASVALKHWRQAVLANLSAPLAAGNDAAKTAPIQITGVSALQQLVSVNGKRPDGQAVQFAGLWFAHGTQVFHAAIYAAQLGPDMREPFFNGLKLQ
jgi:hypothetical protein